MHAGESQQRLDLVAAWRETKVFTEAERAALELAEQGTRLADAASGVSDEAWANAAKHYDDEQLVALVAPIALINAWNRMNVITQQPARRLPARPVRITIGPHRRRATWLALFAGWSWMSFVGPGRGSSWTRSCRPASGAGGGLGNGGPVPLAGAGHGGTGPAAAMLLCVPGRPGGR